MLSTCGQTRRQSSGSAGGLSRSSRTAARRWAHPTRTRTARSGPAHRCRMSRAREDANQREYFGREGRSLLGDVADLESQGTREVLASDHWLAIVPFWAVWPFETLLIPRVQVARLPDLDDGQRDDLADVLGDLIRRYDALFDVPFPYSMGWHGAPFEPDAATDAWRLHAHVYPPLLRSASVRKFMVGYELLAEPQRDLLPEDAAQRLRAAGAVET